jgi:hypothetical protein
MKTFKELQDEVLDWMADGSDTGALRDLVTSSINRSHQRLLTSTQWDFMLWPKVETLAVAADRKFYPLHPYFFSPLWFYNPATDEYLEEVNQRSLMESEEDWDDGELAEPERFSLTSVTGVARQPTSGGTVTVTATGGTESSSSKIVIKGIVGGVEREETLSSGSAWTTLTSSLAFEHFIAITKVGSAWTRTITITHTSLTDGTITVLSLLSDEYGKQYRQLELLTNPSGAANISYRFFQKPITLVRDNDLPQIPEEFSEILVWDTLLKMQGYARSTGEELALFKMNYDELRKGLDDNYKTAKSVGARPRFIHYIPRV